MKTESKIEAQIRQQREKLKKLQRERAIVKRRRIAQERKRLDHLHMLLGRSLVAIASPKTLERIKGHLGKEKSTLVHRFVQKDGEVVEDDTDFREIIAYLEKLISRKGQLEGGES